MSTTFVIESLLQYSSEVPSYRVSPARSTSSSSSSRRVFFDCRFQNRDDVTLVEVVHPSPHPHDSRLTTHHHPLPTIALACRSSHRLPVARSQTLRPIPSASCCIRHAGATLLARLVKAGETCRAWFRSDTAAWIPQIRTSVTTVYATLSLVAPFFFSIFAPCPVTRAVGLLCCRFMQCTCACMYGVCMLYCMHVHTWKGAPSGYTWACPR